MTCRRAKEFLSQKGVALRERDLFKDRLTRPELERLAAGRSPATLFAWKSPRAKALALQEGQVSDERLMELMLGEPYLIRRPLIVIEGEVVVGFDAKRLASALA